MSQSQDSFRGDIENSVITQASYNLFGSSEGRKRWRDRCDKGTMRKIVISVVEKYWVGQKACLDFSIQPNMYALLCNFRKKYEGSWWKCSKQQFNTSQLVGTVKNSEDNRRVSKNTILGQGVYNLVEEIDLSVTCACVWAHAARGLKSECGK